MTRIKPLLSICRTTFDPSLNIAQRASLQQRALLTSKNSAPQYQLFTTSCLRQKPKDTDLDTSAPRKPRVFITNEALEKEYTLDENIPARQVQVKDAETGKLLPPQSLISVLSTIDRDVNAVRLLVVPEGGTTIVQIVPRSMLIEQLKEKEIMSAENARAARAKKPKRIEINWALSSNDLQMKLRQLRDFVESGKKVEILLASKKRQRRASPDEAQNVLDEIQKATREIDGCREVSPMEGKIGGQALLVVQKQ